MRIKMIMAGVFIQILLKDFDLSKEVGAVIEIM